MAKVAIQGGVKNYLGDQKTVGKVPIKWKSGPDHPETELAYITKAEKDLLLKKDLHNSLNGKPNRGPSGVMSLNGWGDKNSDGSSDTSGGNAGAEGGQGSGNSRDSYDSGNDRGAEQRASAARQAAQAKAKRNNEAATKKAAKDLADRQAKKAKKDKEDKAKRDKIAQEKEIQKMLDLKKKAEEKKKIDDALKAESIYKYKKNPIFDFIPYKKPLDFLSEKFISQGSLKNRMDYINSLPPQQKRAMIEKLGLANDEEYDELDEKSLKESGLDYFNLQDAFSTFNDDDLSSIYGKDIPTLSGDPKQYQGLGSNDAFNLINYDGNFLKEYGQNNVDTGDTGGENNQEIFSPIPKQIMPVEKKIDYRFGDPNLGKAADVTRESYDFNQGGVVPEMSGGIMGTRARRAMGGIMNRVDQRQGYFLGKIVKGIKGAVSGVADAAGKVLKSDVGKMAMLAAGAYYMPGYGIKATGGFGNMFAGAASGSPGFFSKAASGVMGLKGKYDELGTLGKMATMGGLGLGLSMIPGLNKAKPNETSFSDRGGSLKNSQGQEGQEAIQNEIQEAYKSGDPQRIAEVQQYYNYMLPPLDAVQDLNLPSKLPYTKYAANGGRIGRAEGGLMDLGGMEKDYRAEGGFVPIGEYEKKDDVPARLSVNEFVFTADAVRGAGQGDIDKGAEIMENMMENLENGGTISEESQGNNGAQQMFETSERLGEVL